MLRQCPPRQSLTTLAPRPLAPPTTRAQYARAIEYKQVSQQEAERSKFVVLRAEQERRAAVIRAEGEAEAAKLISQATKSSPALVELRRIEAAKEVAQTLSRSRNVMYLPGGQNMLLSALARARATLTCSLRRSARAAAEAFRLPEEV